MLEQRQLKGLFVTNRRHVGDAPGGVQTCSREYLSLLNATGFNIDILPVDVDMRLGTRIRRRLRTSPYTGSISITDSRRLVELSQDADLVFLNQVALASALQEMDSDGSLRSKTVLLSHGAEVTDLRHIARLKTSLPLSGKLQPSPDAALRNVLGDEIAARAGIAAALCLSLFDRDFERWLGVRHVAMIPRTVTPYPLVRSPVHQRFGFLGTLDHAPSLEGLVEILHIIGNLNPVEMSVRIVGGPERIGTWLAERYRSVQYLGPLPEDALLPEASTWSAFLNPIFCQARGCSTKVATALAWQLPIITTSLGRRGYVFSEGSLTEVESPDEFVAAMRYLMNPDANATAQQEVARAAQSCPSMEENAHFLGPFLARVLDGKTARQKLVGRVK
jgi:hypothetical protein